MKKNMKGFAFSLVLFGSSIFVIAGTLIGWWTISQPIILILFFWILQLLGIAGIAVSLKKPKPNYDWEELEEYEFFEILSLGEDFIESPEKKNIYGWMIVQVNPSFGPTLVFFPTSIIIWNNQKPEIGANYMRIKERIIKLS